MYYISLTNKKYLIGTSTSRSNSNSATTTQLNSLSNNYFTGKNVLLFILHKIFKNKIFIQ